MLTLASSRLLGISALNWFIKKTFVQSRAAVICQKKKELVISERLVFNFSIQRQFYSSLKMECCGNACGPDFSKEALKQRLTAQQYQVTQEKDTERAFTGKYYKHFEKGTYTCIVCSQDLFSSDSKYDSKCGWPAFFDIANSTCVKFKDDLSHVSCNLLLLTMKTDMKRKEALCSKCGAHLGHMFEDGPKPTGKRYCINSAALNFRKTEESSSPNSSS